MEQSVSRVLEFLEDEIPYEYEIFDYYDYENGYINISNNSNKKEVDILIKKYQQFQIYSNGELMEDIEGKDELLNFIFNFLE